LVRVIIACAGVAVDMQQFRAVARQTGSYNASRVELCS